MSRTLSPGGACNGESGHTGTVAVRGLGPTALRSTGMVLGRAGLFWRTMARRGFGVRRFHRGAGGMRRGLAPDAAGWRRPEAARQA